MKNIIIILFLSAVIAQAQWNTDAASWTAVSADSISDNGAGKVVMGSVTKFLNTVNFTGVPPSIRLYPNTGEGDSIDSLRAHYGLATSNNHFINGTVAEDLVIRCPKGGRIIMGSWPSTDANPSINVTFATTGSATFANSVAMSDTLTINSLLKVGATSSGSNAFTTTATKDTVLISGAKATDLYFVTPRGSSISANDVLSAEAKVDTLIVHRPASGTSGLNYSYLRVIQ